MLGKITPEMRNKKSSNKFIFLSLFSQESRKQEYSRFSFLIYVVIKMSKRNCCFVTNHYPESNYDWLWCQLWCWLLPKVNKLPYSDVYSLEQGIEIKSSKLRTYRTEKKDVIYDAKLMRMNKKIKWKKRHSEGFFNGKKLISYKTFR